MSKLSNYSTIKFCRLCKTPVNRSNEVFKIAPQHLTSVFVKTNENNPKAKIKIPLTVILCFKCGLVQIKETTDPDLLYENYFYRSNISNTMKRDLQDVVDSVCRKVEVNQGDKWLDIGCNDGLMMTMIPEPFLRYGIDPALNIKPVEELHIIRDYFPSDKLTGLKFKVITSCAMFYDLDDPNKAVKEIKKLLDKEGVVCIQVSYLYDTIRDMNFYDFCHEHLEYYSLKTLRYLMTKNGMKIFDASTNFVNGGSIRIYVTHKENNIPVSDNINFLLKKEEVLRLEDKETYKIFDAIIQMSIKKVLDFIKSQKGLVIGLGASTKGNVLIQMCKITKKIIPYLFDRNPIKWGLRTLGTDIEIISEGEARKKNPQCMFVIPWNFKTEIVRREKEYVKKGGKLLFIMPYPYILDKSGEHRI